MKHSIRIVKSESQPAELSVTCPSWNSWNISLTGIQTRQNLHSGKTNIAMEHGPLEDVFPINNGDSTLLC